MSALADPFDVRLALGARGLLRTFNEAGVLAAADVHVALRLAELGGEPSDEVRLALALAVRAPRHGHVYVDLATVRETAAVETDEPIDLAALPWPAAEAWTATVAGSGLVAVGEDDPAADQPLRLIGTRLYLDRYWREERAVAGDLNELAASRRLEVIVGGPGTGKTTRVAREVVRLVEDAGRPALIALAAPTGKAAARLEQAVHHEAAGSEVSEQARAVLMRLRASTLHRLLGWRPGSHSRFAHDRANRLPHDVVVVDETSMVSLWMMARLTEAVRPDARLILVGDPGQLSSIEAGVVLGDIVASAPEPAAEGSATGIVMLDQVHRFGGAIAELADAIRAGDADATIEALRDPARDGVTWIPFDVQEADLAPVRARAVAAAAEVSAAAREGDARRALDALGAFRLLCAHRRGPYGVSHWTSLIESWVGPEIEERDYVGRPLLVTENDYELGLNNGDTGVIVVDSDGHVSAAFERGRELLRVSPLRLGSVDTVYAMTIHKSQGSQYETAAVLLPAEDSRILTRELLYTAVTRARRELILAGTEETVRSAVERPVARASGLRERLRWPRG